MDKANTQTYTVVTDKLELPRGAKYNVEPGPVESGQLAMVEIGGWKTVGRYYPNVAGVDYVMQPGLIIRVEGEIPVRVVGPVRPCTLNS